MKPFWYLAVQLNPKSQLNSGAGTAPGGNATSLSGGLHSIINLLIFIIGAVSVLMIVVGGLRYVLSEGNSDKTKGAKDQILYAIVGIIIAILAWAIVQFVTNNVG